MLGGTETSSSPVRSRRLLSKLDWEGEMEVIGFIFGSAGLSFALLAWAKIAKLESQLSAAGVLGNQHKAN